MKQYSWIGLILLWSLAMSCATQTTPMGGPKDSIPPTPERYVPMPNQTNYRGKEIAITFSEAIQLNNPKEEIIIIPSLGKKTQYKLKGNTLIIVPENDLKDSTTYNINFREGVKDLTEGIPAVGSDNQPLHLAFSTGPIIDTLQISGTITNALTEIIPEDITVALYTSDTFNIFEDTPDYFTKSNKQGNYTLTNLKAGVYRAYAFEDKNKNLKAETRSEKFGFSSQTIRLDSMTTGIDIALVNVDSRRPRLTSTRNQSTVNILRANKSLTDYQLITSTPIQTHFNNNQTEIIAYYPSIDIDSLMIQVKATDSTEQVIDTLVYIKRDKREKIKEAFKVTSGDATYNLETGLFTYSLTFNKPIKKLLNDSIYVQYDSLTKIPLKVKKFNIDTMFNKLEIEEVIAIDSLPATPKVTIASAFLISIDNDSSKLIQPGLKIIDTPTTATLLINIETKEPHFIVQLLNGSNKVIQTSRDQRKITFKFLPPETLKIRAIIDTNGNGKWDTAIYPQNREPEKIIYYKNAQKKAETPLRANWEVGPLTLKF